MCIALIGLHPYDVHVQLALGILKSLYNYNKETDEKARRFKIRIGINQNTDILVRDINGRTNVAGAGINDASRVMGRADGNQILVSRSVFDELQPSEKYLRSFRPLIAIVKHSKQLEVYQYVAPGHSGLNTEMPSAWVKRLSPVVAYYLAHAVQNRAFLLNHQEQGDVAVTIGLLWLLAVDSLERRFSTETKPYVELAPKDILGRIFGLNVTFSQRFFSIGRSDATLAGLLVALDRLVVEVLSEYEEYFEPGKQPPHFIFINELGRNKLKNEWPDIWSEFNLS
jgi:hypothetical protein